MECDVSQTTTEVRINTTILNLYFPAVLLLYLRNYLHFDDDTATAVYHAFTVLAYFTPVLGAIIADSYWGKYKVRYEFKTTNVTHAKASS